MKLSDFEVAHKPGPATTFGDPLIRCYDGSQLVQGYIDRKALDDYFQLPGGERITVQQLEFVVQQNLDAFARIIDAKYQRGEFITVDLPGGKYPRVVVTEQDMTASGEKLSADVLKLKAGFAA